MPEQAQVKVRGIRQLTAGSRQLAANIDRATDAQAVQVTAQQTAATIRSRVPRRSGALAGTVRTINTPGTTARVTMGGALPYARWIEFGHYRNRAPRGGRYVYPTAKRTERAFQRHCENATAGEIRRMHWPPVT